MLSARVTDTTVPAAADPPPKSGRFRRFNPVRIWREHRFFVVLTTLVLLFVLLVFWHEIVVAIYPGEQGVYWSRLGDGTQPWLLREGFAAKFPWDRIYVYDIRLQKAEGETRVLTKDGLILTIDWTFWFQPDTENLPRLHQRLGPDYPEKVVIPAVVTALRKTIGNFRPEEIYHTDEQALNAQAARVLESDLSKFPIVFHSLMIRRLLLPKAVTDSIEEKLVQEQRLLAYEFRLRAEDAERKRRQIEALGIQRFEELSGVDILRWRGIEATLEMAKSPNAKIVVIGTSAEGLPIILNTKE